MTKSLHYLLTAEPCNQIIRLWCKIMEDSFQCWCYIDGMMSVWVYLPLPGSSSTNIPGSNTINRLLEGRIINNLMSNILTGWRSLFCTTAVTSSSSTTTEYGGFIVYILILICGGCGVADLAETRCVYVWVANWAGRWVDVELRMSGYCMRDNQVFCSVEPWRALERAIENYQLKYYQSWL